MQHDYFGPAVAGFDDTRLAQWLVVAGAAPLELQALLEGHGDAGRFEQALDKAGARDAVAVSLAGARRIAQMMDRAPVRDRVVAALPAWWARLAARRAPTVSITGAVAKLDRQWLARLLAADGVAGAVWFPLRGAGTGLWEWPLRIGVPAGANDLFTALSTARYGELFTVERIGTQDSIVDLLVLPGELHQAVDTVPAARTVADAVLVLGDTHNTPARTAANLDAVAARYRSGAVALCGVASDQVQPWFQALVRELSHNHGLPVALFTARRAQQRLMENGPADADDFTPPVLAGSAGFFAGTFIADAARRLAAHLQQGDEEARVALDGGLLSGLGLDPGLDRVRDIGRELTVRLPGYPWINEGGDATQLVRIRRALEQQLGRIDTAAPSPVPSASYPGQDWKLQSPPPDEGFAMSAPPDEPAAMPPPPPDDAVASPAPDDRRARDELRYVHARVAPPDAPPPSAEPVRLQPDAVLAVHVHIGADRGRIGRANVALDETSLPESETGHDLTIAWVPLTEALDAAGGRARPTPETATLHLPPLGDSATVVFTLRCGASPAQFRARLVVLHENRVLQTLMLTAADDGSCSLVQENRYAPGFTSGSAGVPADIAFVVNDDPQGVSGLTAIAGASVSFHEPAGLKASLAALRKAVAANVVAAVGAEDERLGSDDNLQLMRRLAKHGATILKDLQHYYPPLGGLAASARVQVVEAVAEAFFPVEFLYSGRSPLPEAALCPQAAAALAPGGDAVHAACPNRDSRDHVCPAAFWGLSKCIERHAHGEAAHRLSVPTPGDERIGPFTSALVAASQIAAAQMAGPQGVPALVHKYVPKVSQPTSWAEWEKGIAQDQPDLLVLLPHTGESPVDPLIPSLEISSKYLDADNIEALHVRAAANSRPGPLVLLLGCHTSVAQVDFMGTVGRFMRSGAPVVVGTLSVIHATQAGLLATRLLEAATASGHVATRFDEALLQVKRELLAAGHGVAFTLVAYGHSSWRL